MPLLEITGLRKSFTIPDGGEHCVIAVDRFELGAKAQMAISGESGSGKTTFLHLIAGILKADAGTIRLVSQEVSSLSEAQRDRVRATTIGYIFQSFNLLPAFTCLENVLLGMAFGPGKDRAFAESLLRRVGLGDRMEYYPHQLSTGQQQRAAVARALANRPQLVLADEPTGNLDRRNAQEALSLVRQACAENGAALLLVSHDRQVLAEFDAVREFSEINRTAQLSLVSTL